MNLVVLVSLVILKFVIAQGQLQQDNYGAVQSTSVNKNQPDGASYFNKMENIKHGTVYKMNENNKRRMFKKTPKRTIQKIIKRNKTKKKMYMFAPTNEPTAPPVNMDMMANIYEDSRASRQDVSVTTQETIKKRQKKWSKIRYPMPFQKLQSRNHSSGYNRERRKLERDNTFIFQNLDEIEITKKGNEYNVVNGHAKKYW